MPITVLNERVALVMIDLQRGILRLPPPDVTQRVVDNARQLAEAFRAVGAPVIAVNVAYADDVADAPAGRSDIAPFRGPFPADWSQLVDELDLQPEDIRVTKHQWNAFHGTDLDVQLRRRQLTDVVVVGVATSRGVESTVRSGYEFGYNMVVASDAVADPHTVSHNHSLEVMLPQVAEIALTADILASIPRRGGHAR